LPSELVAVLGTLLGVLLGGLMNYFINRRVKSYEWRLALARDQSISRQKLYAEFLVEAQRLVALAREEKISSLTDLDTLNAKFADVSLVAPDSVLMVAQKLADYALTSHSAPPAKEVRDFFKLREEFIVAVRQDISNVLSEG